MAVVYSGTEGTCQWTIDDNGILSIGSGTISRTNTSWSWNSYKSSIRQVVTTGSTINFSINSKTGSMFNGCSALTSLDLSGFNTSNVIDMSYMFYGCTHLISLDLSGFDTSDVTSMICMFYDCRALTSLNLSGFNTSKVTNMIYMFSGCYALTSLNLSSFNTSNVSNMSYMFSNCFALTSLNLSNFNTSKVTNMTYMFNNCRALTSLNLSNFNTSNVTNMLGVFGGCEALISLDLSGFNTSNVTDMHLMFYACRTLTSLNLSNFNTSNVTNMERMFEGCRALASLNLSNFNTSNVTDMSGMFNGCQALTSLNLSSFDTSNVTDMANMFNECRTLTSLNISSFNTSKVTDMCAMFNKCYALTSLNLSNFNTSKVTDMSSMFNSCEALTSLDLSEFDTGNVTDMGLMFFQCKKLTSLNLSSFDTSKVTIMSSMFAYCRALTSFDLSGFNTSNVIQMSSMFSDCKILTSLNLSNFNTSKVINMSSMFLNCSVLTSIIVSDLWQITQVSESTNMFRNCNNLVGGEGTTYNSNYIDKTYACIDGINGQPGYLSTALSLEKYAQFDSSNSTLTICKNFSNKYTDGQTVDGITYWKGIENITGTTQPKWYEVRSNIYNVVIATTFAPLTAYRMFYGCSNLTSLNLSNLDTSNVTDMSYMFYTCRTLTSLDLSGFDTSNVEDMSDMFYGCNALTSLNLSSFNTSKVTDMQGMFYACYTLTSLDLSGFDTSKVINMSYMFSGCEALTSLNLSSFDTSGVEDMSDMFCACQSLTSLDLSDFDTSGVEDMSDMFCACQSLISLDLSDFDTSNVTVMDSMFDGCNALTSLDISSFDTNKVTDMSYMFMGCQSLTSLNLSSFDTSSVEDMSDMFYNCQSLTSLNLSNFNTSSVEDMQGMFVYCRSLTSLDLSGFDTSNVTSMQGMFYNCQSLISLDLSSFDTSNVADMQNMFMGCQSLTSFNFYVNNSSTISSSMFYGTTKDIYIIQNTNNPDSQTSTFWRGVANDYTNVHYEADDHINYPSTITGEVTRIDEDGNPAEDGTKANVAIRTTLSNNLIPQNVIGPAAPRFINTLTISISVDGAASITGNNGNNIINLSSSAFNSHTFVCTVNDINTSSSITLLLSRALALLDFLGTGSRSGYIDKPGMGMAIGKFATRNGLDIQFPTTIGMELLPATKEVYEITGDQTVQDGKTYYEQINNNEYEPVDPAPQVGDPIGNNWYELIGEAIDLDNYQLIIGQYNEKNNDTLFIIGNGSDDNNRSNLFVIDKEGNLSVKDGFKIINDSDNFIELTTNAINFYNTQVQHNLIASIGSEGMKIYNSNGRVKAQLGDSIILGEKDNWDSDIFYSEITNQGFSMYRKTYPNFLDKVFEFGLSNGIITDFKELNLSNSWTYSLRLTPATGTSIYIMAYNHGVHFISAEYIAGTADNTQRIKYDGNKTFSFTFNEWDVALLNIDSFKYTVSEYGSQGGFLAVGSRSDRWIKNQYTATVGTGLGTDGENTVAIGKYNISSSNYVFMIGNGTEAEASNALTVDWNGAITIPQAQGNVIQINNNVANTETFIKVTRTDTNVDARFGVGSGGNNIGIHSNAINGWICYANYEDKKVYLQKGTVNIDTSGNIRANGRLFSGQPYKVLWSGAYYMDVSHEFDLSDTISNQPNGIVLVWSAYVNGAAQDYDWIYNFVSKWHVANHSNQGIDFLFATSGFGKIGAKYLYISNSHIKGNANNIKTGTTNGVTYANNYWVLRAVLGV